MAMIVKSSQSVAVSPNASGSVHVETVDLKRQVADVATKAGKHCDRLVEGGDLRFGDAP